ncbi:MAG TPA: TetR/AcrR family transcriptional regulator [Caulobacteraceae bacterium]|nr:TetR/AcrR family transcriptional regulator [Caulobacteraceae bacterium]
MPRILTPHAIEDFRERLSDAAEQLFAEHGPDAVTIRQLANAVGVSAMTPYRYFADKDAILAAVRARAFNRHADALEAAFSAAGEHPTLRRAAVGEAYVAFAEAHPAAYKLMFDLNQPGSQRYPDLVAAGERSRRTMTLALDETMQAGAAAQDVEFAGHLYWAAIHGALMLELSGMLGGGITARALMTPLVAALDRQLGSQGAVA